MIVIHLDEIKDHGITRQYLLSPHEFSGLAAWEESGDFELNEPVRIEVSLVLIGGLVEVNGYFATSFKSTCGRCLKNFSFDLSDSFEWTFTNQPLVIHEGEEDGGEGVELSAEELGLIPFVGESINLTETISEQVFLALPVRPLCAEGCKGLCPHCGIDLNEKECHCAPPDFNNKFTALKNIKIS